MTLHRLSIENMVIVERAEMEFGAGLTTITGESGAGKSLVVSALSILFGATADASQVGPWGDHVWIEGEFTVPESFWSDPELEVFGELRPDDSNELTIARRVNSDGRTRAFAWGRSITRAALAAAGARLVAVAGQHSQRRLMGADYQRGLVDAAGGAMHQLLVASMQNSYSELRVARSELERLMQAAAQSRLDADRITADLEMIEQVGPSIDDEVELLRIRDIVRHHTQITTALQAAISGMTADGSGAVDLLGAAWAQIDAVAGIDESLQPAAASILALQSQISDLSADLRSTLENGGVSIDRPLSEIEDRLSEYDTLRRRFGGTTEAVITTWESLKIQQGMIENSDEHIAHAQQVLEAAENAAHSVAAELSASRLVITQQLAPQVHEQLALLGMADSIFTIDMQQVDVSASGADAVSFMLAPNAKIAVQPLSKVASGGELSRVALALMVVAGAGEAQTVLFDEVDAGIGGNTGTAIGSKLAQIATHTQVLCVTHLAQVAAFAAHQFSIEKKAGVATVRLLNSEPDVVDELARMVGGQKNDDASRTHAQQLRLLTASRRTS